MMSVSRMINAFSRAAWGEVTGDRLGLDSRFHHIHLSS
jgi:hypothetical protein